MADEDVATRAPESDAQEQSGIAGDTKPDQGAASMGVSSMPWTPCIHRSFVLTASRNTALPIVLHVLPPTTHIRLCQTRARRRLTEHSGRRATHWGNNIVMPPYKTHLLRRADAGDRQTESCRRLHIEAFRLPTCPLQAATAPDRRHGHPLDQQPDPGRQVRRRRLLGSHARPVRQTYPTSRCLRESNMVRFTDSQATQPRPSRPPKQPPPNRTRA